MGVAHGHRDGRVAEEFLDHSERYHPRREVRRKRVPEGMPGDRGDAGSLRDLVDPPPPYWLEGDKKDYDPDPSTFESRRTLLPGQNLQITFNLTDDKGKDRWAYDFSTEPYGSGTFGLPQCATTVTMNGSPYPLQFASNDCCKYGDTTCCPKPVCWYTNLLVQTPTGTTPKACSGWSG